MPLGGWRHLSTGEIAFCYLLGTNELMAAPKLLIIQILLSISRISGLFAIFQVDGHSSLQHELGRRQPKLAHVDAGADGVSVVDQPLLGRWQ